MKKINESSNLNRTFRYNVPVFAGIPGYEKNVYKCVILHWDKLHDAVNQGNSGLLLRSLFIR